MIIDSRQDYLRAMGVQCWLSRPQAEPQPSPSQTAAQSFSLESYRAPTPCSGLDWDGLTRKVSTCTDCALHASRTQTVFGVGNQQAEWLFVGEAPGAEEDRQGEPFVGRAGQLLNGMLAALKLDRGAVYIANVLKCRPPENRDPQGEEVMRCESHLHRQVELIKPRIIVALGRFAAQSLLKTTRPISRLRGIQHTYGDTGIPLVVTYHPAYLLRSPLDKRKAWLDLCTAREILKAS